MVSELRLLVAARHAAAPANAVEAVETTPTPPEANATPGATPTAAAARDRAFGRPRPRGHGRGFAARRRSSTTDADAGRRRNATLASMRLLLPVQGVRPEEFATPSATRAARGAYTTR